MLLNKTSDVYQSLAMERSIAIAQANYAVQLKNVKGYLQAARNFEAFNNIIQRHFADVDEFVKQETGEDYILPEYPYGDDGEDILRADVKTGMVYLDEVQLQKFHARIERECAFIYGEHDDADAEASYVYFSDGSSLVEDDVPF